jgi:hypothetical protein
MLSGGGLPFLATQWSNGTGGGSPLVANSLLYYAGGNALRALDPKSGAIMWSNTRISGTHWQSPVLANGTAYVADIAAHLTAFTGAGAGLGRHSRGNRHRVERKRDPRAG